MGLEFGMGHLFPEASEKILGEPGLDFVIGSCHNLDEAAGGRDFYLLPYDTLEDCYRALDNYFQSMLAMAASPCYDVVGHVIYPLRYMNGPYDTPSLDRYRDQIRRYFAWPFSRAGALRSIPGRGRRSGNGFPFCGITGS